MKRNITLFVLNKPMITKRKYLGSELVGYKVTDYRDKAIIKRIKQEK